MRAAALALQDVAAEPDGLGGNIGVVTSLHTAARTLIYHPHVHCLVTAGALSNDGLWRPATSSRLAPERRLAMRFRRHFLKLAEASLVGSTLPKTSLAQWKVFQDLPRHGPVTILRYFSKTLFSGPLAPRDLCHINDNEVEFLYRDRRGQRQRKMRLAGQEFLRRYLQHVWPSRIHKVQYHGLWSRKSRPLLLALKKQLSQPRMTDALPQGAPTHPSETSTPQPTPHTSRCPHCNGNNRFIVARFSPGRAPALQRPKSSTDPPT